MQEAVSRPRPGSCGGTVNGETGEEGAAWAKSRRLSPNCDAEAEWVMAMEMGPGSFLSPTGPLCPRCG